MKYFVDDELPSCSTCTYATKYIPQYSFPFTDPVCELGHGACETDKLCEDYVPTIATCGRCEHIRLDVKGETGFHCIFHNIPVHFAGKFCDEYEYRHERLKEIHKK